MASARVPTVFAIHNSTQFLPQSFGLTYTTTAAISVLGSLGLALIVSKLSGRYKEAVLTFLIGFSLSVAAIGLYGKTVGVLLVDTCGVGRYTWAGFRYENHAAVAMLIGFVLLLDSPTITKILGLILLGIAVWLTQCRSVLALMCLTVSLRLILYNRKLLWPIVTISVTCVLLFTARIAKDLDRHVDFSYRIGKIVTACEMVRDYPVFGLGWQGYANTVLVYRKIPITIENGRPIFKNEIDRRNYRGRIGAGDVNCDYLQYLVEFGFVGVLLVGFIVYRLLCGNIALWPFCAILCCAVIALIDLPFHSPTVCLLTGLLLGVTKSDRNK